jgi:CheY-like chemotaxis protein
MKLLIAEDDFFFRKLLEQMLAPDYELVLAKNGEKAWAELQKKGCSSIGSPRLGYARNDGTTGLPRSPPITSPFFDVSHHPHG